MSSMIDDVDKVILEALQDDARMAFRKIAEKAGVSEATVFIRVKKLQEKGVIKRFTALVSPEALGKSLTAFVLINADPKRLQTVLETLGSMDDVYEAYDVTGTYYAIIKIRTENREKLAKIIDQIGLIDGVTSTETAIVLRCIKEETRIKP
ncbi:AsnC family transcriptional regulator [Candidatus Bathyarchaeota archaeon ex4484_231]|nr:MAG: AsnC family transcriptional regulator [Candidatus Bathyarchaeota archaeon ex4484_231]RJS75014.1 MAG: Lrp/AsnC family transcriptional regulator [Candidatus Bathyarchaeota archaeon]